MIRIIDGKKYDTETATLIGRDNDIRPMQELYMTPNGAYFVRWLASEEGEREVWYECDQEEAAFEFQSWGCDGSQFAHFFPGIAVEDA